MRIFSPLRSFVTRSSPNRETIIFRRPGPLRPREPPNQSPETASKQETWTIRRKFLGGKPESISHFATLRLSLMISFPSAGRSRVFNFSVVAFVRSSVADEGGAAAAAPLTFYRDRLQKGSERHRAWSERSPFVHLTSHKNSTRRGER